MAVTTLIADINVILSSDILNILFDCLILYMAK